MRLIHTCLVLLFCVFALHASAGARHAISAHSVIVNNKYVVTVTSAVTNPKIPEHKAVHYTPKRKSKAVDTHFQGICQSQVQLLNRVSQEDKNSVTGHLFNRFISVPDSRGSPAFH